MPFLVFPTNQMRMIVGYCFDAFLPPYITIFHVVFFSFTVRIQWQATTGKTGVCNQDRLQAILKPMFPIRVPQLHILLFWYTVFYNSVYIQTQEVYYHPNLIFFDLAIVSVNRLFGCHSVLELRYKANTFSFSLVLYCGPPQSEYVALAEGKSM